MTAKPNQKTILARVKLWVLKMTWENDNRCVRELRARWSIKFYDFASMDVLLLKCYELQIRILTSGRSDIEKINRKKCKIHSDENR